MRTGQVSPRVSVKAGVFMPSGTTSRSSSWVVRSAWTVALFLVFSAVLALAWTRLAVERAATEDILRVLGLAAIPAAVALIVRGRWAPIVWVVVLAGAGLLALADVFGMSLLDARPGDEKVEFFAPLWESVEIGLRGYYETRVTFDPIAHPEMESIMLFAIFGFAALAGTLAAGGWMVPAGLVFLVGVGWPATLRATVGGNSLAVGALILAALLFVLFLAGGRRGSLSALAQAGVLGGVLVLGGVGAATSTAIAKEPVLDWQRWTPYEDLRDSVGVDYVWNTSFSGIWWPDEETVVLTVSGLSQGSYWRATTLDEYNGFGWREEHDPVPVDPGRAWPESQRRCVAARGGAGRRDVGAPDHHGRRPRRQPSDRRAPTRGMAARSQHSGRGRGWWRRVPAERPHGGADLLRLELRTRGRAARPHRARGPVPARARPISRGRARSDASEVWRRRAQCASSRTFRHQH